MDCNNIPHWCYNNQITSTERRHMHAAPTYLLSGSFAYDTIMHHPAPFEASILPEAVSRLNVCFDIGTVKDEFGGCGGNIAYNASLLGQSPMLVGCLGGDATAYLTWLSKNGQDASTLALIPGEGSAHAWITCDSAGNQIAGFSRGAMLRAPVVPAITPDLWHLAPEYPINTATLARAALALGKEYFFDPGQVLPDYLSGVADSVMTLPELLRNATGIFVNDYEAELLIAATGQPLEHWLVEPGHFLLRTRGSNGVTLVVMGPGGVEVFESDVASASAIVDPTGCGDAFRAGFLMAYTAEESFEQCLAMGVVMGSFAIEAHGGQKHEPTREAIFGRVAKHTQTLSEVDVPAFA